MHQESLSNRGKQQLENGLFCCEKSSAHCETRFLQLVSFRRSHEVKGPFSLGGAANRCDISCRTDVTLRNYAMVETFFAASRDALPKVESISTSRNGGGNHNVFGRVCYTWQFFVQLVSQQNCETSCTRTNSVMLIGLSGVQFGL